MRTERERVDRLTELRPFVERARRVRGWTLDVAPVPLGQPPSWDYLARARELISSANGVLDLGTGGGERFAEICQCYCRFAVATEAWHVNAPIAAKRLAGIAHVVRASSLELPFAPETFDLLLDRHEELEPNEIGRVLRPRGILLTQQVIPEVWCELRAFFPRMTDFGPHFERYQTGLQAAGLVIRRAERHAAPEAFRELGELVYMLTVAPWTISDFDLERDLDALLAVEKSLSRPEGIVLTAGHYLIEAWKGP